MMRPPERPPASAVSDAFDPFDAASTAEDVYQSLAEQFVVLTRGRAAATLTLNAGAVCVAATAGEPSPDWCAAIGDEPDVLDALTGRTSEVRTLSTSTLDADVHIWPVLALSRAVAAVAVLDGQTGDHLPPATCRYAGLRLSQLFDAELRADQLNERGAAIKTLRRLADTDALTGVSNRSGVFAVLNSLLGRGEHVGLLYLDLDDFKQVNDSYGHAAGDRVLAAVAKRLRRVVRAPDLVGRIGGDEFVLVVRDGDERALTRLLARINEVLHEPVMVKDIPIPVHVSCGIAVSDHGGSASELLALADARMYGSKQGADRGLDRDVIDLNAHRNVLLVA